MRVRHAAPPGVRPPDGGGGSSRRLVAELFKAFGNGIFYSHDEVHLNMIVQKFVQLCIRNCVHHKNVL